ncbi:MAG: NYN domain-containing protein [Polyangiaceae bacterium]|nr:NYN domain-containing protein [Polyangiaceae bacterium]
MIDETGRGAGVVRVRAFVDFWNFTLSVKAWRDGFPLDWQRFGPWLTEKAGALLSERTAYAGLHLYMSYDPAKQDGDAKLKNWAKNVLDRFPGVEVVLLERKAKAPPKCPRCFESIKRCPKCDGDMRGTVEKGVDTTLVTDMIRLAWEDAYDVAVLVTSDRDFIPAVEFLNKKGRRVINGYFPPQGSDLAAKCWANIRLVPDLAELER